MQTLQLTMRAAEAGDLDAQYICYEHGTGTAVDPQKAIEWYTKAAESGDFLAQYYMRNRFPSHVKVTAMKVETSGNEVIDKLIQDTPFLDWIPYKYFHNIIFVARGGF